MALQPTVNYHVIPRRGGAPTWESPGTAFRVAVQVDEWYQEIATSHRTAMLLAMTVVFDVWSHLFCCTPKRSFLIPCFSFAEEPRVMDKCLCEHFSVVYFGKTEYNTLNF